MLWQLFYNQAEAKRSQSSWLRNAATGTTLCFAMAILRASEMANTTFRRELTALSQSTVSRESDLSVFGRRPAKSESQTTSILSQQQSKWMNGTADGRAKRYCGFHSAHRLCSRSHEKVCSLHSWPSRGMTYMIHGITFERRAKISKGAHRADRISRKHSQVCKYRWLEWSTGLFRRSQYTLWDEKGGGWGWTVGASIYSTCHVFQIRLLLKVKGLCGPFMTIHHIVLHSRRAWNDPTQIVRTVTLHTFTATIHVWGRNTGKEM